MAENNDSKLNVNRQSFDKHQRKEVEKLVKRLKLDRNSIERGDFIAMLHADAERIQSSRQFQADKDVAKGGLKRDTRNDFANNSITQFHMKAIEEITNSVKSSNRHQLKNNMARIEQLTSFLETSDVQDKKFLQEKFAGALKFVEIEHKKKSKITTIVGNNLLDLTTQYMDIKSLAHGLFDNNPAMMAVFSLASKSIKKVRENKQLREETLGADAESAIVNARTETINEKRRRKEANREATLSRLRRDNGADDDEILGSFDGSSNTPNKVNKDESPTRIQSSGGGNSGFSVAGDNRLAAVNGESIDRQLELSGMIQKDVQLIREFLVKDKKSNRAEELQMQAKAKLKNEAVKNEIKKGEKEEGGAGEGSIFDTLGDFFGGEKGKKGRKGRRRRGGKFGKIGKFLSRGKGLARAGLGLAVGGGLLGGFGGDSIPDVIPDKKVAPMAAAMAKSATKGSAAKTTGKGIAKGLGKSVLKKIPGIGMLMGLAVAGERLMDGDLGGAGLEALSGLASSMPGIGTAASFAIDGALMAKDAGAFNSGELDAKNDVNDLSTPEQKNQEIEDTQKSQLEVLEDMLLEMQMGSGTDIIRIVANQLPQAEALKEKSRLNTPILDQIPESGIVNDVLDALRVLMSEYGAVFGGRNKPSQNSDIVKQSKGLYSHAINDPNYEIGSLTRISETGKLGGAGTISTGVGDFGGKSYGSNQLSSKTGTLQEYLGQSQFGSNFAGLTPGSKEFDSMWTQLASQNKGFGKDQNAFIDKTHFTPFKEKAEAAGLNVSGRSNGVQEILHSTSNQFGANSSIFKKFAKRSGGVDVVNSMSDSDLIEKFSQFKSDNVGKYFKSSSGNVQAGVKKRFERERVAALGLDVIQGGVNPMALDGAGINTANNENKPIQVAALESKTDKLFETVAAKQQPSAPVTINQGGGGGGSSRNVGTNKTSTSGLIARNLDSTISRLSDRFISDSLS